MADDASYSCDDGLCPPAMPPLAPPPEGGNLPLGIALTIFGAAVLALSMIVQRYALAYPSDNVPFICIHMKRGRVWGVGLLLYIFSNVFKALGSLHGPLTVLASVFTLLLIFNLFFARWLLHETITPPKILGAVFIVVGAGTSTLGTPGLLSGESPPTLFEPKDVRSLLAKSPPHGIFFLALLLVFVLR